MNSNNPLPICYDADTLQYFFFDKDGVPHYYETLDECAAAAALIWYR